MEEQDSKVVSKESKIDNESESITLVKNKDYSALSQHDVDDTVIANNNNNQKDNSYNNVSPISSSSYNGNFAEVVSRLKL